MSGACELFRTLFSPYPITKRKKRTGHVRLGSHHVPTTKSTPFMVSEDEWDVKEGPGKSMKNVLYVLWCAERHI